MDSQRRLFQLLNKAACTLTPSEQDELYRLQIQDLECQQTLLAENPDSWAVYLCTVVIPPLIADLKARRARPPTQVSAPFALPSPSSQ
jgi:hypothetical protein